MKKIITVLFLALILIVPSFSLAEEAPAGVTGTTPAVSTSGTTASKPIPPLTNPIKVSNVQDALFLTVDLMIFVGTILAVLAFIFIGFKFVMAQGNDTELVKAKKWFMYAAIGTAILISSKVIVEVIKNTFVSTGIVNESLFKKQ